MSYNIIYSTDDTNNIGARAWVLFFIHTKLCLATAKQNFKWVTINGSIKSPL